MPHLAPIFWIVKRAWRFWLHNVQMDLQQTLNMLKPMRELRFFFPRLCIKIFGCRSPASRHVCCKSRLILQATDAGAHRAGCREQDANRDIGASQLSQVLQEATKASHQLVFAFVKGPPIVPTQIDYNGIWLPFLHPSQRRRATQSP